MFHKKQGGPPDQPFSHSDTCKIVKADPGVEIPWSEVESGYWTRTCQCGVEHYRAPAPNKRTRLDPLDPGTAMHLGAREFRETTDPAVLQVVLRVRDGANASYSWVTCGSCDSGWPVPVYAEAG